MKSLKKIGNATNRIRIAIQKSGRLSEASQLFLARSGIEVKPYKEQLLCASTNFPLDLLLVRDDDIPSLVAEGSCDFGIVGNNVVQEKMLENRNQLNQSTDILCYLGFASCRLSLAVPKRFAYQDLNSLKNCRIATSYPALLHDFMQKNNMNIEIYRLTGSVEIAPSLGIADGICDLVSSGATLAANNLQEVATIFKSEAVLIKTLKPLSASKQQTAKLLEKMMA